jgi:hypothetical protein
VNPDKSQNEYLIHDSSAAKHVLHFQTGSGEGLFLWTLRITGKRRAHLIVVDHRQTKWGPSTSELEFEDDLTRK